MKFKSAVYTQVSGSLGGITYAHNRGGMYARARSSPINPNTTFQQAVRDAMRDAVTYWTVTATDTIRSNWTTYAANTPVLDVFGEPRNLTGQQMYLRTALASAQVGDGVARTAPSVFDLGTFTPVTFTVDVSNGNVSCAFDSLDAWANEVGGHLLIKESRPQNATINFFKGPWRYLGSVIGAAVAPTSPETFGSAFTPYVAGQKRFFEVRALRADGRLTNPSVFSAITVA